MARIRFELPSLLHETAGGPSVTVEATTIAGALSALAADRPALARQLLDDAGGVREHVLLYCRDADAQAPDPRWVNTRWMDSLEKPLADGEVIRVVQAVSGG